MIASRNLADWLVHLEGLHPRGQAGVELGLERVRVVGAKLRQKAWCPVIIVAGTNGKGSTCAYLETILDRAAYRVGCYTSPHLVRYNERVRIGTHPVADDVLCRAFARVEAARGDLALTYFEFGTLAAWEVFAEAAVDAVVMEVGLGGRLDAVNIYEPDVSIVTGIALDHTDYLGPTRETIGAEKAAIFRPGKPAICADPEPPASLLAYAARIGAALKLIGRDFGADCAAGDRVGWRYWHARNEEDGPGSPGTQAGNRVRRDFAFPALRGRVQIANAAAALTALECLRHRLPVAVQAIRRGLLEVALPGRFQVLPGRPAVVVDVAHNPQACAVLADNLDAMGYFEKTIAIVGMLADKDIAASLRPLVGKVSHWLAIPLPMPRGASAARIAAEIGALAPGAPVECCADAVEAAQRAAGLCGEADRIIVFGSFLTVREFALDVAALDVLLQTRRG